MPGRNAAAGTPVPESLISRVTSAARYVVSGVTPASWFGPAQPMRPQAQEDAHGRALDFPTGYNLTVQPRAYEPITFPTLRALADACELMRLVIESRKDQVAFLDWTIARKDGGSADKKAEALTDFFRYPDQEHDWNTWVRLVLEDMLVIDAPAIYRRTTKGGALYACEVVDGATIKRVLDDTGRTPVPPSPAYQQILKGVPATDYTVAELLYAPRNPRPHKVYGMSPVEQTMITINTAIRRAVFQMDYYTEGNVPDALMGAPATWTADQIQQFQTYWDLLTAGEQALAMRRKLKMVPDGTRYIPTKTAPLFDVGDEWLARVVCYAFSVSPQPFIQRVNRSTSETQAEAAIEEARVPTMRWIKSLMDRILAQWADAADYEFAWEDLEDVDPSLQAEIDDTNIKNRSRTINEVRADRGDPPVPWGDEPPAPGKPIPDPDPIDVGSDDSAGDDAADTTETGDTQTANKAAAGRALQRPGHRPRSRRRFLL